MRPTETAGSRPPAQAVLFGGRGMPPWVWRVALAVQVAIAAGYFLLPDGEVALWAATGYLAALLTTLGAWVNQPNAPEGWYLLAAGQACFISGDVIYFLLNGFDRSLEMPTSLAPLVFYLGEYTFHIAGMVLLVRARVRGRDPAGLLDALIIAVGLCLLVWVFLVRPGVQGQDLPAGQLLAMAVFPFGSLLELALFIRLWTSGGRFGRAFWMLGAAQLGIISADVTFSALSPYTGEMGGFLVDLGWIIYLVGLSCAALHPSMRWITTPTNTPEPRLDRLRLGMLAVASLLAPGLQVIAWWHGHPIGVPVIAACSAVLFALTLTRIALLAGRVAFHEQRREFTEMLLRATEGERLRLAADLHDGPVQSLTAMGYTAHRARRQLERGQPETATTLLEGLERELNVETGVLRQLMTDLRPPVLDEQGLGEALRQRAKVMDTADRVLAQVDVDLAERLPADVEMVLYRVAQECMANVTKHADAERVTVRLASGADHVELVVSDDGVGFEVGRQDAAALAREGHVGLVSMSERVTLAGGEFSVDSTPGKGTAVRVWLPLRREPGGSRPSAG